MPQSIAQKRVSLSNAIDLSRGETLSRHTKQQEAPAFTGETPLNSSEFHETAVIEKKMYRDYTPLPICPRE
jgi:hypothetical protein